MIHRLLLLHSLLLLLCFATLAFGANRLATDEVQALKDIAKTLGKTNWNFSADPCSGEYGWITPGDRYFANNVTCGNCTISDAANATSSSTDRICHVVSILLRAQNLPGTLPAALARLPYLQQIDLARNYLNGTIPPEWGSLPVLVNISLVGNRLTGSVPVELANITTLKSLTMDFNNLSGGLPWELGFLPSIEILILTSNNFTGELPDTFAKLTKLKDFRIIDNSFSGKIPNYIQNWTNLKKLGIQASGLTGPIPSGISLLTSLTDLRITDLNGPESSFPQLENMKNLKILMLRSCSINGQLPEYFSSLTELTTLDLSFNKLTGKVPRGFVAPTNNLDYIFLTGNLLNGPEPLWMVGENVDLSYNNFTVTPGTVNCQPQAGWNLFAGSSKGNSSAVSCLSNKTTKCSKSWYSLNINCGGSAVTVNGTAYDEDTVANGPSSFYMSSTNWVSSSTGYFPDDDSSTDHFTWSSNSSRLSMANAELYKTARLSPISLTYYGFCLLNGNYTVNLHFAEIVFTNGPTYSSLGRRFFDVYIQGIRVLQDFNIADEAGGAGKAIIKNYTAAVTTNVLEIRFFWAGKGTTGIPVRGVYGPLVSAISVVPADFKPPAEAPTGAKSRSLSTGAVVGIMAAGGIFLVLLIFGYLWWKGYLIQERTLEQELKGIDLQTGKFSLRQIEDATKKFDIANKIGEGGFGPVYKGQLSDGTLIAIKQLSAKSKQGNREFLNEIGMISALQHPHLVKLHGCCIEGNQLLLVYEYMENNSLGRALLGAKETQLKLDWPTRHRICVGIAKGLAYLHEESRLKVVHRDIKATNVLLDRNLDPKISDFGLAKLNEDDSTHISTRIAGTRGYMAPEYAMRGYLTDKADVYSFGILVLEIVSGRCNTFCRSKEECFYILDWAVHLQEKSCLLDLVDPRLESDYNKKDMMTTINVALLCCNTTASLRPAMSSVVKMLQGKARVEDYVLESSVSSHEISEMRKYFESSHSLEAMACESTQNDISTRSLSNQSSFRLLDEHSNLRP